MTSAIPSPNIWESPEVYELENRGVDRAGVIEAAMRQVHDWAHADVLDVGCGTGFHLPRFAATARSVVGIEPHPPLVIQARRRVATLPNVRVVQAGAESTSLADRSIDVVHARWAYFFGPGCEPGLAELDRVVRPGGTAFVIDNDATRSTFGAWFRRSLPRYDSDAVERFWVRHGWARVPLDITWEFDSPEHFARVLRIEFPGPLADAILAAEPERTGVDYAANLWWRRWPTG
ncbi:MAG TPA: class I SAM-dependent methyltransferase [Lapillicoccus sp.]|nr:class I SAM-dependent methyltransferase [Lapillicoccus sp.]